jgi:hypothetical protein
MESALNTPTGNSTPSQQTMWHPLISDSCCVLLASKRFFIDGKWHTLINYDRFFELLKEGREFSPEEYVGDATPEWANWGNGGFDPSDERVYRKGKGPDGRAKAKEAADARRLEKEAEIAVSAW